MLTEPRDLDRTELAALLERHWGLRDAALDYLPVGFGSHHWKAVDHRGTTRFVTADDLEAGFQAGTDSDAAFAALDRAYRTAAMLHDEAGLEFVVAPVPDEEGKVVRRLGARYAVTSSPFVEGESSGFGAYETLDDRREMGRVLGRLHAATELVPNGLPRREDLTIPSRAALARALDDLERPWSTGPFGESTRHLLRENARDVWRRLGEYDALAARIRQTSGSWVLTHGEPHRANVIRDPRGGVHLVDWDTTLIAPRERDLRMVLDDELTGWAEYVAAAGAVSLNREALELYHRWWDLTEVAIYTALFRRPHERTEDTTKSFENLSEDLQDLVTGC